MPPGRSRRSRPVLTSLLPGQPPRGPAPRPARLATCSRWPRCSRPRATRPAAADRQLGRSTAPARSSSRASTSSPACTARATGPSKLVEAAGRRGRRRSLGSTGARGFPTFLYVHTMDPHVPYAPPAAVRPEVRAAPDARPSRRRTRAPTTRSRSTATALIAQYDGDDRRTATRSSAASCAELKARGLYDRALIVFLADHGEEFLDHGKWLHGRSVFDELIRVPLIVKFPGRRDAGQRVTRAGAAPWTSCPPSSRALGCRCPPAAISAVPAAAP